MTTPRFQIISDLHLETPIQTPSYTYFSAAANFPLLAPNLLLLGDIGLIAHKQPLLAFLRSLLQRDPHLNIFYILGNHESYQMTLENALAQIQNFETTLTHDFGPRFHLMDRRRVDLTPSLTLLGCTLWTHVPPHHAHDVAAALKDFDDAHGVWDRSLDDHNADHARDLAWLNAQVSRIEESEPQREIVVLTHHSPTTDARANSARFLPERALNSGFRTDLRGERCWDSVRVKVWAFGHTHFSCQFVDTGDVEGSGDRFRSRDERRKLVVSNQKGYAYPESKGNWKIKPVIIGREEGEWKVVIGEEQ
ncbi:Metallo-dependent phosphatase-like protein [Boeremia exigua]|uniref:Metallo-dependent phosphatase-like protein n=1 Tax=Boeremia exigua TaxID=749465 RepID=UPI001E8DABB4|nr:Metallo-dependent phosphatase-like protein [Boeremia exigua]KAH6621908.1 Metallo-dependent phosphatase-like protein [Boeremia exigua]